MQLRAQRTCCGVVDNIYLLTFAGLPIAIFLLLRTLLTVVGIRDPRPAADNASPLQVK